MYPMFGLTEGNPRQKPPVVHPRDAPKGRIAPSVLPVIAALTAAAQRVFAPCAWDCSLVWGGLPAV